MLNYPVVLWTLFVKNIINNRQQHNPPSWVQNVKMVGTQPLKNDKMQNIKTERVKVQNVRTTQTTKTQDCSIVLQYYL